MSRFDPPEPGPVPKCKNDDSTQGGPFKMNLFEPRTTADESDCRYKTDVRFPEILQRFSVLHSMLH